jgi:hypothetical protein
MKLREGIKKMRRNVLLPFILFLLFICMGYENCSQVSGSGNHSEGAMGTVAGNPFTPDNIAALPEVELTTTYPQLPSTSQTLTVGNGSQYQYSDCQQAINAAQPGDVVSIEAEGETGTAFVCNPIVLPSKPNPNNYYIVIQTANLTQLTQATPLGTRISSDDIPNLAVIETQTTSAISAAASASYYYMVGIEARVAANTSLMGMGPIVELGSPVATSLSEAPSYITVASSYVHGTANQDTYMGVDFNGSAMAFVDSMITEIHSLTGPGRGISVSTTGFGPFKIDDDEIESAGSAFALVAYSPIVGMIPSDIEFQNNYLHRNPNWATQINTTTSGATGVWSSESLVEMANAQRVLFNSNIFEDAYALSNDLGSGYALAIKPSSSAFGTAPVGTYYWDRVQDITFTNNEVDNCAGVTDIFLDDSQYPAVVTQRLDFYNNIAYDIGTVDGTLQTSQFPGMIVFYDASPGPIEFNHNTLLDISNGGPPLVQAFGGATLDQFTFTNNIINDEGNGIYSAGNGTGTATLNADFPGVVLTYDAFAGQNINNYQGYTSSNWFPSNMNAIGFQLAPPASGSYDYQNLTLLPTSLFYNAASDGTNVGANIGTLNFTY